MSLASVLVLLLVSVFAADALPGGAPAPACTNGLTPQHGAQPQVGMSPYELDLSAFNVDGTLQYTPGNTYTLTFRGMNNATFRGFFVRCRVVADGSYVGEFAVLANEPLTRLSSCTPAESGVTHNNTDRLDIDEVQFRWTAPAEGTGNIEFRYTGVQVFDTYWVNRATMMVEGPAAPAAASGLAVSVLCLLLALVPLLQL